MKSNQALISAERHISWCAKKIEKKKKFYYYFKLNVLLNWFFSIFESVAANPSNIPIYGVP